jgi:hypothetical protein
MATHLPMVEVLDVFLVEKDFQIAVEAAPEIGFQFQVQPVNQCGDCLTGGSVALMGVGDEKISGHCYFLVRPIALRANFGLLG